jgi:hypothetical protein
MNGLRIFVSLFTLGVSVGVLAPKVASTEEVYPQVPVQWSPAFRLVAASLPDLILEVTGNEAKDCGIFVAKMSPELIDETVRCINKEWMNFSAFRFILVTIRGGQQEAVGVLGDPVGIMYRFEYKAVLCGGTAQCAIRFDTKACQVPLITSDDVECEPPEFNGKKT